MGWIKREADEHICKKPAGNKDILLKMIGMDNDD